MSPAESASGPAESGSQAAPSSFREDAPGDAPGDAAHPSSPALKRSRTTSLKQRSVGTPAGHLLPPRGRNDTTPRTRVLLRARNEIFEMLGRRKRGTGASQPADAAAQSSAPARWGAASHLVPRGGGARRVRLPAAPESQRTITVDDTCTKPCLVCFRADTSRSVHQPAFMLFGPSEQRPSHYALISVDGLGNFSCTSNDNGAAAAHHSPCKNRKVSPPGDSDDDAPQPCPHATAYFAVCRQLARQQALAKGDDDGAAGPADEQLFIEPFRIATDTRPDVRHGRKYQTFVDADNGVFVLSRKSKRRQPSKRAEDIECLTCMSYTCDHARRGPVAVAPEVSSVAARRGSSGSPAV